MVNKNWTSYLPTVALSLLCITNIASARGQAGQSPKIQLVVIGVPEFTTPKYNVRGLKEAIEERCNDLDVFFTKYIGKGNLKKYIYCTKDKTTSKKIKRLLGTDFKTLAANTLTFLFIISHGEAANYDNKGLPTDLKIVASNSDPGDPDITYLSFVTELLPWFGKIPQGSTVLTFIDTCYAGNAASPAASMSVAFQQVFGGTRLFVMGSSLRLEESFGAAFTKALITLWAKQDGCVDPATMNSAIKEEIDRTIEKPLSDVEGIAKVIVGYAGPLCFGNFGAGGRLLFLYGGIGPDDMIWKVFDSSTKGDRQLKRGAFTNRFFDMVRLDSGTYKVQFLTKGQAPGELTPVDLKAHTFEAVFAQPPKSVKNLQNFFDGMRAATVANGSPTSDTELLDRVSSALATASNRGDADTVVRSFGFSGARIQNLLRLQAAAFKNESEAQRLWQSERIAPEDAAAGLFLLGDFGNAAEALKLKAFTASDEQSKRKFAEGAFQAFTIAGRLIEAAGVRTEYGLNGPNANFDDMRNHFAAGLNILDQERRVKADFQKAYGDQRAALKRKVQDLANQAVAEFETAQKAASENGPNGHLIWAKVGEAYDVAGLNDDAANAYQHAIDAKSDEPDYYNNLGNVMARAGKIDEAKAAYIKSIELAPQDAATAWRNLGISLYNANRSGDAVEPLQKSVELDLKNAQTWYLLGAALLGKMTIVRVGDKEVAEFAPGTIEAFQKAIDLDPAGPYGAQAKQELDALQRIAPNTKIKSKKKSQGEKLRARGDSNSRPSGS